MRTALPLHSFSSISFGRSMRDHFRKSRYKCSFRFRCWLAVSVIVSYICLRQIIYLFSDVELVVRPATATRGVTVDTTFSGRHLLGSITHQRGRHSNLKANCTPPAILEFPSDGLTLQQRQDGWIIIHIVIAFYCFWFLAVICDDYFVPAIEEIVSEKMQKDVAGATFMAAAISVPELCINSVGTFVTKNDIGVGTIVGSALFSILAVPACCGLVARDLIKLDWWPLSRDCLMYCVSIIALIGVLADDRIMWYEALALIAMYAFYMLAMYNNTRLGNAAKRLLSKYRRRCRPRPFEEVSELSPLLRTFHVTAGNNNSPSTYSLNIDENMEMTALKANPPISKRHLSRSLISITSVNPQDCYIQDAPSPWRWKEADYPWYQFILGWPITFVLWATIPDSHRHPRWRYVTLLCSVIWNGIISYLLSFVVTVIGDTLFIPDSVMSLTILAAGMCLPEAVSSILVIKQGQGAMGMSISIGSNTFEILVCLALPWLIKALFLPTNGDQHWVTINSNGITYSAMFLLIGIFGLYWAFASNQFYLNRRIGMICALMYILFIILAALIELNVFFPNNLPVCDH